MVRLLLPILIGLFALGVIEFSGVMAWLLVQPTGTVLLGLTVLSAVVLMLSRSVANQADRVAELIGQSFGWCSRARATRPWPGIRCSPW